MVKTVTIYSNLTGNKKAEYKDDVLVWHSDEFEEEHKTDVHHVMNDIQPYQSMIDGQWISSRSHHKAHLKAHNCIEVGNEVNYLKSLAKAPSPPPGLKETLIGLANEKLRYK